jgi:hypothetical protein
MGLFDIAENLIKASVAVAATPVALVSDIVQLPAGKNNAFENTESVIEDAKKAFKKAVEVD